MSSEFQSKYIPSNRPEEKFIEDTRLHRLISAATENSIREAWRLIGRMNADDFKAATEKDRNTYLHHLISVASRLHAKAGEVTSAIPLMYKLILRGVDVNAKNNAGNTAMHLACFKPFGDVFCQHLIRAGADPGIANEQNCRVIHCFKEHSCQLVKGQKNAKSGIWSAVESENIELAKQYLNAWVRVNTYRQRRKLMNVADETGNIEMLKLLERFENTNELVCAALACDGPKVKELLSIKTDRCNLSTCDESFPIPKPLVAAVKEMGQLSADVVKLLLKHGATDDKDYQAKITESYSEFQTTPFYLNLEENTPQSTLAALEQLKAGSVNVHARSNRPESDGYTYLHLVVERYYATEDVVVKNHLVRILYRLALDGVDVNARDAHGDTILIKAFNEEDRRLLEHVIRLGVDASIPSGNGEVVCMEKYDHKGRYVLTKKPRRIDMPGLWVAVEDNDVDRVKRWLKVWCRVNITRFDRKVLEVARAKGYTEVASALEEYAHVNEFVCSTFACDTKRMKHYLALGKGKWKVNIKDEFYHAGYKHDRSSEYVPRPLIISAIEICTAEVVRFLLEYGADLTVQYEECAPCGPAAFWAFRDVIDCDVTKEVAKAADLVLRDERGATMLHKAILKKDAKKAEIVKVLLERGINVASRDLNGLTGRDYCTMGVIPDIEANQIRPVIDDYVLYCVSTGEFEIVERLILDGYDHILDISGTAKKKTARELAYLKEQKDILELLAEIPEYEVLIDSLHTACKSGDLKTLTKLSQEKKGAYGKDKGGRNMLHMAVLWGQAEVVACVVEQYPDLIKDKDNLLRTPVHYACCLGDGRKILQIINTAGMTNLAVLDANNISAVEYVREMDKETPTLSKTRGRRVNDYKVREAMVKEREKVYGELPQTDGEACQQQSA
ncbi:uncharacterized protein LOC135494725 [Lineus longissimus]|uniref:uncharacterized protein LOC135494725 n=1 Tax=Lineus longissimus TaxID=88925 RepID=UPI002B4E9136